MMESERGLQTGIDMGNGSDSSSLEILRPRQVSSLFKLIAAAGLFGATAATMLSSVPGWPGLIMQGVSLVVYALAWGEGTHVSRLGIGVLLGCATVWGMALARAAPEVLTRNAMFDLEKVAPWIVIPALVTTASAIAAIRPAALSSASPASSRDLKLMQVARLPSALVALVTVGNTFATGWWAAGALIALAATGGATVGFLHGKHLAKLAVDVSRGGQSERRVVWALLLLALALRVAAVVVVDIDLRHRPDYRPGPDGMIFHNAAKQIARGQINILRDKEGALWIYNPGPTLFYSAWYASFGDRYLPVGLIQALLGAGGCWFTWRLARFAAGPAVGIIALMLVAGRGYLVTHQAYLGAEAIAFFLVPLSAWYLVRTPDAGGSALIGSAAIAGLALGVATLFRPEFLLFPVAAGAWLVAHRKPQRHLPAAVLLVLVAGLPSGLWILRNANVHGYASLQGNPGNLNIPRSQALGLFPATPFGEGRYGEVLHATAQAFAYDPMRSIEALWLDTREKMAELFDVSLYAQRPLLVYVTTKAGVPLAIGGVLLVLTGVGAVAGLRSGIRNPAATITILIIAYKIALHIPLKLTSWYRVTMEPFLMVLVGIGVVALFSGNAKRDSVDQP